MPQYFKRETSFGIVAIWKIEESAEDLLSKVSLREEEVKKIQTFRLNKRKQEFLAVRCLLKQVLDIDPEIDYLESGKPILTNSEYQLSISHTKGFVAVALSKGKYVGIDIEYPSERVVKVYNRFINEQEGLFIPKNKEIEYYTLIWCLKETMYKMIDKKSIIFNEHFICEPFQLNKKGTVQASYREDGQEEMEFEYIVTDDYYLVYHC